MEEGDWKERVLRVIVKVEDIEQTLEQCVAR